MTGNLRLWLEDILEPLGLGRTDGKIIRDQVREAEDRIIVWTEFGFQLNDDDYLYDDDHFLNGLSGALDRDVDVRFEHTSDIDPSKTVPNLYEMSRDTDLTLRESDVKSPGESPYSGDRRYTVVDDLVRIEQIGTRGYGSSIIRDPGKAYSIQETLTGNRSSNTEGGEDIKKEF